MKVLLKFFQDDATGEWGVSHKDTYDDPQSPFNSGWNDTMIFHDVFEHWHEKKHKYFMGKYAMNVGGEMAAMGAMWYFVNNMGFGKRLDRNSIYTEGERMRQTTEGEIEETICYGYARYGNTLECSVPYQLPVEDSELEYQCEQMWKNVKDLNFKPQGSYDQTSEKNGSQIYKKSVTLGKIQRLHRWGYRNAERMIPRNSENINMLYEFWEYWGKFTKQNSAEELANMFDGIEFNVKKHKGVVSWTATLKGKFEIKDFKISSNKLRYIPYVEDFYTYEEDYN